VVYAACEGYIYVNTCKILGGNLEGKRPLRRPRLVWKNTIKLTLDI
jgi:hypothetical protein